MKNLFFLLLCTAIASVSASCVTPSLPLSQHPTSAQTPQPPKTPEDLAPLDLERPRDGVLDAARDPGRLGRVADCLQQHGELVSPQPGHGVLRPDAGLQPVGAGHEELVAGPACHRPGLDPLRGACGAL